MNNIDKINIHKKNPLDVTYYIMVIICKFKLMIHQYADQLHERMQNGELPGVHMMRLGRMIKMLIELELYAKTGNITFIDPQMMNTLQKFKKKPKEKPKKPRSDRLSPGELLLMCSDETDPVQRQKYLERFDFEEELELMKTEKTPFGIMTNHAMKIIGMNFEDYLKLSDEERDKIWRDKESESDAKKPKNITTSG